MSGQPPRQDLVVLAADRDMTVTLESIFHRPQSLGTRSFKATIYPHVGHDPGCRGQGVTFLRSFAGGFHHALLIFDLEGSGREATSPESLESELESELQANGWDDRGAVIVIAPELESWFWSASSHVDAAAGWSGRLPRLRDWLILKGLIATPNSKPARPKEALRSALREVRKPPSPAIFQQLASKATFKGCQDRAFLKLVKTLQQWFPGDTETIMT